MKVTVLIENTALEGFECEHGLSFFIEFNGGKYLLDSGQSGAFIDNAGKLGIDVSKAEYVILSHGHYDHAGGFGRFLDENGGKSIYAMKGSTEEYYSASGGMHPIGIPQAVLSDYSDRFVLVDGVTKIADGVYLIPHTTEGLSAVGSRAGLYHKVGEDLLPDDFSHEISLVFDTDKGLIIFNSCSHAGLCNIIREVKEVFPSQKVYAFLGGLHMKGMRDGAEYCTFSEQEINELADFLKKEDVRSIYTGHCTGNIGTDLMADACRDTVVYRFTAGQSYDV